MAYIEDANLVEEIKSLRITVGGKDVFPDVAKESVLRIINEQPHADFVEVVRCKDCKHSPDNGGDCDRVLVHTCRNHITETNEYLYFKLNYCEYGERK